MSDQISDPAEFALLAHLPFSEGEHAAAMTVWEALGANCIVMATDQGRMFVLRIEKSGKIEVAGPLAWRPA